MVELSASGEDGLARRAALESLNGSEREATSTVTYESRGRLLVLGPRTAVADAASRLARELACTVLVTPQETDAADTAFAEGVQVFRGRPAELGGHLGAFLVELSEGERQVNLATLAGHADGHFDMVLDLGEPPQLPHQVPPPGYYAPRDDTQLAAAIGELTDLTGEFAKPRYFRYDPDICAHGASGLSGCTRCLEACPTLAIRSIGELVEVDPYLCQGAGTCATSCPSGAITYAYPPPADLIAGARELLRTYREAGGRRPVLLFHDAGPGARTLDAAASALPENVIPVEVEEIGSVGADTWLSALAFGAHHVVLLASPPQPERVMSALRQQLHVFEPLLQGLGMNARVRLVEDEAATSLARDLAALPGAKDIRAATFATFNEKRMALRSAIEHLHREAPRAPDSVKLPDGAPYGEIEVSRKRCTLCMACVGVCPVSALSAADDTPRLSFLEDNCVQCGLCETACPEDAITLAPRIIYDSRRRREVRVLNEEPPFCCVVCGKPFATQSMMTRMQDKLAEHWMFRSAEAKRRIEMCEDCRVKDMYAKEGGIDPYGKDT